ncbi:MAG TPA: acyl carrier protein [Candidatus Avimonas sp.]|nr:acyl carrier protein [Clostridiales bacterium]HOB36233.1 acyl carrier protein [Candidatus Avimonas sp.]HQA16006.1 acyl carrier protein [Candidatus Avimonas sp.]HQD38784.1 acyl carrier protein [Candidatus Avimonas sp.]
MTFEKVKEIILDCLKCDEEDVVLSADLQNDLGADSLDGVELIMAMEDEFGVTFPEDTAVNIKTVEDIVNYIESQKSDSE